MNRPVEDRDLGNEQGADNEHELLLAIAALTGTQLEDDGPAVSAWSQIRCSEVGQVTSGKLPWRPAVGGECYYYANYEWRLCTRLEDGHTGLHQFRVQGRYSFICWAQESYDGIRPLGSLPIPASAVAKQERLSQPHA